MAWVQTEMSIEMSGYIDRTPSDSAVAFVNDGTVTIRTRVVGTSAVVDIVEESPALARPASKTVIAGLVRGAARAHVSKPRAVGVPIADTEIRRESHSADVDGRKVTSVTRVRTATFVIASR